MDVIQRELVEQKEREGRIRFRVWLVAAVVSAAYGLFVRYVFGLPSDDKDGTHVENKELAFTIHADADTIPARALDQHVTVGGPYFDVLNGTYRIEPLASGGVRLHLSSEHRLSTTFNGYASMWTDFIMRDTQRHILEIVARRAESRAAFAHKERG